MKLCKKCLHFNACEDWSKLYKLYSDCAFPFEWEDSDKPCAQYNPQTLPPAYIGMKVWSVFPWHNREPEITEGKVSGLQQKVDGSWKIRVSHRGYVSDYTVEEFKKYKFLTKEAAEESVKKVQVDG